VKTSLIKLLKEISASDNRGSFNGPLAIGSKKWNRKEMEPFSEPLDKYITSKLPKQENDENSIEYSEKTETIENITNMEKKTTSSSKPLKEDLGVWFGTKKKPKGSKQPAGPWVNICRKKEGGGHPPCGRPEADSKSYPKCRAKGVAANMTDAQKKSACSQKRRAEKSNPKVGTGNKPTMVSNKKKSQNESLRDLISKILKESFK
jgi:hypothetical protein